MSQSLARYLILMIVRRFTFFSVLDTPETAEESMRTLALGYCLRFNESVIDILHKGSTYGCVKDSIGVKDFVQYLTKFLWVIIENFQ